MSSGLPARIPLGRIDGDLLPLGGSVVLNRDAVLLEPNESPASLNFITQDGRILIRPALVEYADFSTDISTAGDRANRWTGLQVFEFEYQTPHILIAAAADIFSYNGSSWTDRTAAALTTGDDLDPWETTYGIDGATVAPEGAVFLGNGDNECLYWSSASGTPAATVAALTAHISYSGPASLAPRYLAVFGGRLIMAWIKESGDVHQYRVRWSDVNNFLEFDTTAGAGTTDLADTSGEITGVVSREGQLLILKSDAISVGVNTGATIDFPAVVKRGCLAHRSFQEPRPGSGFFLSEDNVYLLEGLNPEPIGNAIAKNLLQNLNYNRRRHIVGEIDLQRTLYRLHVPIGSSDEATRCYTYNWRDGEWSIEEYPTAVHAAGRVAFGAATTIGDLSGTIGSYTNVIGDWSGGVQQPKRILSTTAGSGDYRVHVESGLATDEGGSEIQPMRESKDYKLNPGGYAELRAVTLYYSSDVPVDATMSVSTDRGASFSGDVTKTLGSGDNKRVVFTFQSTGLFHRFRLRTALASGQTTNPAIFSLGQMSWINRRRRL